MGIFDSLKAKQVYEEINHITDVDIIKYLKESPTKEIYFSKDTIYTDEDDKVFEILKITYTDESYTALIDDVVVNPQDINIAIKTIMLIKLKFMLSDWEKKS